MMVEEGEVVAVGIFDEDGCFFESVDVAVFAAVGFLFGEGVEKVAGVVDGVGDFDVAASGSVLSVLESLLPWSDTLPDSCHVSAKETSIKPKKRLPHLLQSM
jgi:hypothetical protein